MNKRKNSKKTANRKVAKKTTAKSGGSRKQSKKRKGRKGDSEHLVTWDVHRMFPRK